MVVAPARRGELGTLGIQGTGLPGSRQTPWAVVVAAHADGLPENADIVLCADPPAIHVAGGRYAPPVLAALASDFAVFLKAFIGRMGAPLATLPLGGEMAAVRNDLPGVEARTIHAMFADSCRARPDAPALEAGPVRLSYRELEARVARLAGALAERGAAPGVVVGLCLERSAELVVAMLAILKTGAAYLPLDPSYPADRIGFMLADSGAPIVVASRSAASRLALDEAWAQRDYVLGVARQERLPTVVQRFVDALCPAAKGEASASTSASPATSSPPVSKGASR